MDYVYTMADTKIGHYHRQSLLEKTDTYISSPPFFMMNTQASPLPFRLFKTLTYLCFTNRI